MNKMKPYKFNEQQVLEVLDKYSSGMSTCSIAKEYGVANSTIRNMLTGRTYQHIVSEPVPMRDLAYYITQKRENKSKQKAEEDRMRALRMEKERFTRRMGEVFELKTGDKTVTLQVVEEQSKGYNKHQCEGCYFKRVKEIPAIVTGGAPKKEFDCWKFKSYSNAGECWSAFRTDGTSVIFKQL